MLLILGFLANDPLCQERPVPDHNNDCCVLVVCASIETPKEVSEDINEDPINTDASNLQFLQITPTTVQVQFPGITGGNLMYVQDRIYSKGKEVPWENAIILEGNEIFTLTGLEPGTNYR